MKADVELKKRPTRPTWSWKWRDESGVTRLHGVCETLSPTEALFSGSKRSFESHGETEGRERERERDGEGEGGRRERTEEVGRERGESNRSINDGVREATAIRDGSAKSDNENHFGYQLPHQQSE